MVCFQSPCSIPLFLYEHTDSYAPMHKAIFSNDFQWWVTGFRKGQKSKWEKTLQNDVVQNCVSSELLLLPFLIPYPLTGFEITCSKRRGNLIFCVECVWGWVCVWGGCVLLLHDFTQILVSNLKQHKNFFKTLSSSFIF